MPEPRIGTKMTLDNSQFMRGLRQSTEQTKKASAQMSAAFGKVAAFFGVGGIIAGSGMAIRRQAEELSKMRDIVARFDGDVEVFQKMAQVFKENGVQTDELGNAMTRLERKTADAQSGNENLTKAFEALGIEVSEFYKLSPSEKMLEFSDAVAESEDSSMALKNAFTILEDDAKKLFPLMKEGAANLKSEMEGVTAVTEETIDSYKRATETVDRFFTNVERKAIKALAYAVDINSFAVNNPDATVGDMREFLADREVRAGREENLASAQAKLASNNSKLADWNTSATDANALIRENRTLTGAIRNLTEQLARAETPGGYTDGGTVQESY